MALSPLKTPSSPEPPNLCTTAANSFPILSNQEKRAVPVSNPHDEKANQIISKEAQRIAQNSSVLIVYPTTHGLISLSKASLDVCNHGHTQVGVKTHRTRPTRKYNRQK